jgi:hypothetical protein
VQFRAILHGKPPRCARADEHQPPRRAEALSRFRRAGDGVGLRLDGRDRRHLAFEHGLHRQVRRPEIEITVARIEASVFMTSFSAGRDQSASETAGPPGPGTTAQTTKATSVPMQSWKETTGRAPRGRPIARAIAGCSSRTVKKPTSSDAMTDPVVPRRVNSAVK